MSAVDLAGLETVVRDRFRADPPDGRRAVAHLRRLVLSENPLLDEPTIETTVGRLVAQLSGYGVLQPLCADPEITDIVVNGPGPVWIERRGLMERTDVTIDAVELDVVIERILGPIGLRADLAHPIVDGRLPDGSRVCVVIPPLAVGGPLLAIRRFVTRALSLDDFGSPDVVAVIEDLIEMRSNVVVYGPTGSGKTTLLNAMAGLLPPTRRIITIEDTAELRVDHPHVVRLEARTANSEGAGATPIRSLIRAALRLRPDHLVVGEVRGAEALDMIWALSTGHDGSLSTCHASSADDALSRLETFALLADASLPLDAVRHQVRSAIDVVVGVTRFGDGRRRITDVARTIRGDGGSSNRAIVVDGVVVDGSWAAREDRR